MHEDSNSIDAANTDIVPKTDFIRHRFIPVQVKYTLQIYAKSGCRQNFPASALFPHGSLTSGLMCRTEKIKDDLHRIEGIERYLYEHCIPVAHRSVPESRQFKSLEFPALVTL